MADTDTAKAIELLRQGTPGPWTSDGDFMVSGPDGWTVADAGRSMRGPNPDERRRANARRIAANPLLVEVAAAAQEAKVMIGARLDNMSAAQRYAEVNRAWHVLDAAIANLTRGVLNNG